MKKLLMTTNVENNIFLQEQYSGLIRMMPMRQFLSLEENEEGNILEKQALKQYSQRRAASFVQILTYDITARLTAQCGKTSAVFPIYSLFTHISFHIKINEVRVCRLDYGNICHLLPQK
jgi:hypothetical protein